MNQLCFRCFILIVGLTLGVSATFAGSNTFFTGATLDRETYLKQNRIPPLARSDIDLIPQSVSLKSYAPPVGNQGSMGSCVGWATAYAARTVTEKRYSEKSEPSFRFEDVFSPSYIYNQINKGNCDSGSSISDALALLTENGVLPLSRFPYTDQSCSRLPSSDEIYDAYDFVIDDYRRLGGWGSSTLHITTRQAISRGNPVVIGMIVGPSFMAHRGDGLFQHTDDDILAMRLLGSGQKAPGWGGHAMTIVGYDDNRDGGAFLLMNSWGSDWGEEGFAWVSYQDYLKFTLQAYEVIGFEPETAAPDLGGSIAFFDLHGQEMPIESIEGFRYRLKQPLSSGSRFRTEYSSIGGQFTYVLGLDKQDSKVVELFPGKRNISAYLRNADTFLFPGPSEHYFSQLNSTIGTDIYLVLMSKEKLDTRLFKQLKSGIDIDEQLQRLFGSKLINREKVKFLSSGVETTSSSVGTMTYQVIEIEHIDKKVHQNDTSAPQIVITSPVPEPYGQETSLIIRPNQSDTISIDGKAQDNSSIANVIVQGASEVRFSSRGGFRIKWDSLENVPDSVIIQAIDEHGNRSQKKYSLIVDRTAMNLSVKE